MQLVLFELFREVTDQMISATVTILQEHCSCPRRMSVLVASTGALQRRALVASKADWHFSHHWKSFLGLTKLINGATTLETIFAKCTIISFAKFTMHFGSWQIQYRLQTVRLLVQGTYNPRLLVQLYRSWLTSQTHTVFGQVVCVVHKNVTDGYYMFSPHG